MHAVPRSTSPGKLFVVATPIGNLDDIGMRAVQVLRDAVVVLCEDTRVSRRLLDRYGISTHLSSLHEHNEKKRIAQLVRKLQDGSMIALISDAGTPAVSDPGRYLISAARETGINIVPVPGANAAVVALSGTGMNADRFLFEGFLPSRRAARRTSLEALKYEVRTMVFYEAPHRIEATLEDLVSVFGAGHRACLVKELTKVHECFVCGSLDRARRWLAGDAARRRGEFVIVVAGVTHKPADKELRVDPFELVEVLIEYLPPRVAAEVVAKLGGGKRNRLYRAAVEIGGKS